MEQQQKRAEEAIAEHEAGLTYGANSEEIAVGNMAPHIAAAAETRH